MYLAAGYEFSELGRGKVPQTGCNNSQQTTQLKHFPFITRDLHHVCCQMLHLI